VVDGAVETTVVAGAADGVASHGDAAITPPAMNAITATAATAVAHR
jgi:hypothetical protein